MTKKYKKNTLLIHLIQIIKKRKQIFKLKNQINQITTNLLEFLWMNKFIAGFFLNQSTNIIIIYLKYNKTGSTLLVKKQNNYINFKTLQKKRKWSKNSFFILVGLRGLITTKEALIMNIGGFIFFKLF